MITSVSARMISSEIAGNVDIQIVVIRFQSEDLIQVNGAVCISQSNCFRLSSDSGRHAGLVYN